MALEYKSSLSRYRKYLQTVKDQPLVKASLWVVLSLTLTIVMILTALKPTLSTIAALIGQIEQEKELSARLDEKIRTMQIATRNLDQVRAQLPLLDEAMPDQPNWKDVASRLETEATQSGITIVSIVIENIPVKGKYVSGKITSSSEKVEPMPAGVQKLDIILRASGGYSEFKTFLTKIENLRRLITFTNVEIDKDLRGGLTLTMEGYAIFNNIKTDAL